MEPAVLLIVATAGLAVAVRFLFIPPWLKAGKAFQRAAYLLDGVFRPNQDELPNLTVERPGVVVRAELHGKDESEGRAPATELHAKAPGAPRMLLLPRGVATALGGAVGGQDVRTGHAVFDRTFMLKAADEGLARAWLTAPVRDLMLDASGYTFELGDGRLLASRMGWETSAGALVGAFGAAAALARSGRDLYERWRALAVDLGGSLPEAQVWPAGGLGFDLVVGGTAIRVECARRGDERDEWETRVQAPAAGRENRWPGAEPDETRLRALVAEWAGSGGAAAYR